MASSPLGPKILRIAQAADTDLDEIIDYLAAEAGDGVAQKFADDLDTALFKLAATGNPGVSREHVSPGLRMTLFKRYRIYFRTTQTDPIVIRVLHGARDIAKLTFEDDAYGVRCSRSLSP